MLSLSPGPASFKIMIVVFLVANIIDLASYNENLKISPDIKSPSYKPLLWLVFYGVGVEGA